MQRPLHFDKLCQTAPVPSVSLASPELNKVWAAFQANAQYAVSLAAMPGFGFWMGGEWKSAVTLACAEVSRTRGCIVDFNGTIKTDMQPADFAKIANKHMGQLLGNNVKKQRIQMGRSTEALESFITNSSASYMHGVLESIIRSICAQAWTAAEILFEQTFRAVETESGTRPEFSRFPKFTSADWQCRKKNMGFLSLLKIRNAYAHGFQSQPITDALANKEIEALALLRNIIAHKASTADQQFLDRLPGVAPHLDRYLKLEPGKDAVDLDGEIVRSLVDSTFSFCYTLISQVDAWR